MSYWSQGTVYGDRNFTEEEMWEQTEKLQQAMDGCGTNEAEIIEVLVGLNNRQRQELAEKYGQKYGEKLLDQLKSELSGDLEKTIIGLMLPPREYDAYLLHEAMSGIGTDDDTLIGIMCTRSAEEIEEIKEVYKKEYDCELVDDLDGDASGHFGSLMKALTYAARDEEPADEEAAQADAQALIDAGVGSWGTAEAEFNAILCTKSYDHLRRVFSIYEEMREKTIEEDIDSEVDGNLQNGYLALVKIAKNSIAYFAERIDKATKGFGTDDDELIRIIISRAEVDLRQIKQYYQAHYGQSLADVVESECGGYYKQALLSVIKGTFVEDE